MTAPFHLAIQGQLRLGDLLVQVNDRVRFQADLLGIVFVEK